MMTTLPEVNCRHQILLSQTPSDPSTLPGAADRELFEMQGTEQKRAGVTDNSAIALGDDHDRFVRQPVTVVFVPRRRVGE